MEGFILDIEELVKSGLNYADAQFISHLNKRTIIFNQDVDEDIVERVIVPLLDFEKDDSNAPVTLLLSTEGGSVSDGFVLCNIINNYKKPLNIIVLGYAASMGAVILASGTHNPLVTKKCYPYSYGLLHAGTTSVTGETNTTKDIMNFNDQIDKLIQDFILTNTTITEEEYKDHDRKQWFLTAQQLKDYKFVDEIIGQEDDN